MHFFSSPSLTSPYYPSLSSPMTQMCSSSNSASLRPNVFERLQEDTEKRLRSRLENYSVPRKFALRTTTPVVSSTLRQTTISRSSSRMDSESEMTFKPCINQNSLKIFNNKYLKKAKLALNKQVLYTDEDYSNPADLEEPNFQDHFRIKGETHIKKENAIGFADLFTSQKSEKTLKMTLTEPIDTQEKTTRSSRHSKNVSSKRSQNNTLGQQQFFTNDSERAPVTDRKYVPQFTKPFDLSKILNKKAEKKPNREVKQVAKPEIRPLLRPISDSSLKTEDTAVYQKIVQDRLSKLKELKKHSRKGAT